MLDKVMRKSFANVLRATEVSFGWEVDLLALKSDTGDAVVSELRWLGRLTQEKCDGLVASLGDDGLWSDIDYESSDVSNWTAVDHLRRLVFLARQSRTEAIVVACHKGLSGWLKTERVNPNWWWNEIGCPKELGVFALLFDDELTAEERSAVVNRLSSIQLARTGRNRVWLAECMLIRGLIEGNDEVVATAKDALLGEIVVRDGAEGIQSDWSFHQHGRMPQFGNYGIAYLLTLARWAAVFADAGAGFAEDKLRILGTFLEKGLKKFVWQGRMDVGALGRQFGKSGMRVKGLAVELAAHYLERAGWKSAQALDRSGLSIYEQSAMAVYRAKRWMATVKAETQSINGVEQINGDNLLGTHLADGALFSYVKGDEYEDVFPVWDWGRVPGITGYASADFAWTDAMGKAKSRNQAEIFERGDGDCVRFVLQRDGLSAETIWMFSKDGVDVDVRHVSATSEGEVVTTVEQSQAKPNARWWREGDRIIAVNGDIRYEVPGNAVVSIEPRLGDWHRVMESLPAKSVSVRIFQITVPHGVKPENGACSWKVRFPLTDKGVEQPLVSVVVPVYNVEKYVGECLDSLLAQTYRNIEVICVNDGSTDGSAEILESYKESFRSKLKYSVITQPNAGLSAARNAGMDVATGKYIYFLDSDDMVTPEAIENLVNLAEVNGLDQVIFNCRTFAEGNDPVLIADAENKSRSYYIVPPEVNYRLLGGKELFCELMKSGHFYATQQMRFYKRDVLVANGLRYPEGLVHEDNYMAPVSLFIAERAMIADEKWFLRRVRPNSIMTASGDQTVRFRGMLGVVCALCSDERLWATDDDFSNALRKFVGTLFVGLGVLSRRTVKDSLWSEVAFRIDMEESSFIDCIVKGLLPYLSTIREDTERRAKMFAEAKARETVKLVGASRDDALKRVAEKSRELEQAYASRADALHQRDEARETVKLVGASRDDALKRVDEKKRELEQAYASRADALRQRDEARATVKLVGASRDEALRRLAEKKTELKQMYASRADALRQRDEAYRKAKLSEASLAAELRKSSDMYRKLLEVVQLTAEVKCEGKSQRCEN